MRAAAPAIVLGLTEVAEGNALGFLRFWTSVGGPGQWKLQGRIAIITGADIGI